MSIPLSVLIENNKIEAVAPTQFQLLAKEDMSGLAFATRPFLHVAMSALN
jgi:hypothetical protein